TTTTTSTRFRVSQGSPCGGLLHEQRSDAAPHRDPPDEGEAPGRGEPRPYGFRSLVVRVRTTVLAAGRSWCRAAPKGPKRLATPPSARSTACSAMSGPCSSAADLPAARRRSRTAG